MWARTRWMWVAGALTVLGCGTDSTADVDAVATDEDVQEAVVDDPIGCANACSRAPRCEAALVTEADCNALCEQAESSRDYACCIQYANGCDEVRKCLDGTDVSCVEEGEPWIPLEMFDTCTCGDGTIPNTHECKTSGPDIPCPMGASCFKLANSPGPAFCAVDCTQDPSICPEGTFCDKTPKSNYCAR